MRWEGMGRTGKGKEVLGREEKRIRGMGGRGNRYATC